MLPSTMRSLISLHLQICKHSNHNPVFLCSLEPSDRLRRALNCILHCYFLAIAKLLFNT
ncbi:hypothetical protein [Anabaena azotica]|uniref:Uncharacterized protein n=1 Tax=Anabaena azotica FACHB-119 TaxID=947527 RepID=A0ABR8D4R1_9NOST|nr:hypothetical protein [Anabaena azotica]MBD2501232.1 hypothetical protein [Anabaena azotica FACHB-119]